MSGTKGSDRQEAAEDDDQTDTGPDDDRSANEDQSDDAPQDQTDAGPADQASEGSAGQALGAPTETMANVTSTLTLSTDLTPNQLHAATLTHLWLQETTEALAKEKGFAVDDPAWMRSPKFLATILEAKEKYADWVTVVGSKSVGTQRETHSGEINLSEIMRAIFSAVADVKSAGLFAGLTKLLAGEADTDVTNFMDFWWSHVHRSETGSALEWASCAVDSSGLVLMPIVYYNYTLKLDNWRVMFVRSKYEHFDVHSQSLILGIDVSGFNKLAKQAVEERLSHRITQSIATAPLLPA